MGDNIRSADLDQSQPPAEVGEGQAVQRSGEPDIEVEGPVNSESGEGAYPDSTEVTSSPVRE